MEGGAFAVVKAQINYLFILLKIGEISAMLLLEVISHKQPLQQQHLDSYDVVDGQNL